MSQRFVFVTAEGGGGGGGGRRGGGVASCDLELWGYDPPPPPPIAIIVWCVGLLLNIQFQCCFTSTDHIKDGEPRTAISTFTQLLSSVLNDKCLYSMTDSVVI